MTREVNCGCLFGQTCLACADVDPRKMPRRHNPVERRATVAEGETRLALLERLLGEIVTLHTSLHAAERDPMALAADVMELDEQLNEAVEAARVATGGVK